MINHNCSECGEPIDGNKNTCPYCGAKFVNMTSISLTDFEPFYLMFRCNDYFRTAKVRFNMWDLSVGSDPDKPVSLNLLIESANDKNCSDKFIQNICATWENNHAKEMSE